MRNTRAIRCALAGALVTMMGCSFGQNPDLGEERRLVLTSWAEQVLFPRYRATLDGLQELGEASERLCEAPSAVRLGEARAAWATARHPWKQTEVFAFGPYKNEPLRLGPKIDAWPSRPDTIEALLADAAEIDAELLGNAGVFLRGFPVVEYLLYAPGEGPVAAFAAGSRRCDYLRAATDDLTTTVGALLDAWLPSGGNYLAEFAEAAPGGEFDSTLDAMSELVGRLGFTAENMHSAKLTPPLGTESGSGPDPSLAESHFSDRSLDDLRDNLLGIEALYFGDSAEFGESLGVNYYLHFLGHNFDRDMRSSLDAAYLAIDQIEGPLTVAIVEDAEAVEALIAATREVQRFLQGEVTSGLKFTVGFNDSDGD